MSERAHVTVVPHKCLHCGYSLTRGETRVECSSCGSTWPVRGGVASYRSAEYFGEVGAVVMNELVRRAAAGHWREAAEALFLGANRELYDYIVDLNRAAWIPLLPLDPASTVLDVGCGLGAVTHALALTYERVVAVEPVQERLRFTQVRCEQEGLRNVELIQTTVDALPFFDGALDLIVLNGIVEWLGEWRRDRPPRVVQIETLKAVRRLLRPGGMVLIGIENRIGLSSFFTRLDHSGLRFTNLMPRGIASAYVKLRRPGFYRRSVDSKSGYRTYTYTPRGYSRLLAESGFESVDVWWPRDGYNLPHTLLRVADAKEVKAHHLRDRAYRDRVYGPASRRVAKEWLLVRTGLLSRLLPDDLILMARPRGEDRQPGPHRASLIDALARTVATPPGTDGADGKSEGMSHAARLQTHRSRNKWVIKLLTASGSTRAIAKVANVRLPRAEVIKDSFELQQTLHEAWQGAKPEAVLRGSVPAPIQLVCVGSLIASVEAPAPGVMLQDLSMERGYFADRRRVTRHLELIASWLVAAQSALGELWAQRQLPDVPAWWRQAPGGDTVSADGAPPRDSWIQHGDFFPENIFLDETRQHLCVIDWDRMGQGYPPLFDWFCLVTGMYYTHGRVRLRHHQTIDDVSFRQTYFERSWFSAVVTDLTWQMCDAVGLDRNQGTECFRQYLAVRCHQFLAEPTGDDDEWASRYRAFYEMLARDWSHCVFEHGAEAAAAGQTAGPASVIREA